MEERRGEERRGEREREIDREREYTRVYLVGSGGPSCLGIILTSQS